MSKDEFGQVEQQNPALDNPMYIGPEAAVRRGPTPSESPAAGHPLQGSIWKELGPRKQYALVQAAEAAAKELAESTNRLPAVIVAKHMMDLLKRFKELDGEEIREKALWSKGL